MFQPATTDDHDFHVALENCAREPIHIPGRIQAFGAVIAFDQASRIITHASDNFDQVTGLSPSPLGRSVDDLFVSREFIHEIQGVIGLPTIHSQRERLGTFAFDSHPIDVAVHHSGSQIVVEFERDAYPHERPDLAITQVRSLLRYLRKESGYTELLKSATIAIRRLTGYDRVMAYRFLDDGAGEVLAEDHAPGLEPFLGLRYPASDIPAQVRASMLQMPFRCITDTRAEPSELLRLDNAPPLDLTLTHLKGVSPIHIEYLNNMGVRATMNLPIVQRGELWGLFALHHYRPRLLSPSLRSVCELFGQFFSMEMQQELERESLSRRRRAASLQQLFTHFESPQSTLDKVLELAGRDLMEIVDADGVVITSKQQTLGLGAFPSQEALRMHATKTIDELVVTDRLANLTPLDSTADTNHQTASIDGRKLAGMLSLSLSAADQSRLIFFRLDETNRIRWAGQPTKLVEVGPNGPRLTPRASFQEYIETVSGQSRPWQSIEVAAATEFRTALAETLFKDSVISQEHWRKQKQYQDLLIAELNHRVKNILALVRSIARQTKAGAQSLTQYTESFEKRITALSTAHDLAGGSGLQWVSIENLLELELRPFRSGRVKSSGPRIALKSDVAPVLALVIHELLTNAVKYGALSQQDGRLTIQWQPYGGGVEVWWQEQLSSRMSPPNATGFGMSLIQRAIPHECGGEAMVEFQPQGLRARFWLPSDSVSFTALSTSDDSSLGKAPIDSNGGSSSPANSPPARLLVERALILEDNLILSMELEKLLIELGCQKIDVASDTSQAQQLIQHQRYHVAVLDIHLSDGDSLDFAQELKQSGVPLVFLSGYGEQMSIPEPLAGVPRLSKPARANLLAAAIRSAIEQPKSPGTP